MKLSAIGIGYAILSTLVRILPHSLSYLFGETLGVLHFRLSSKRRRVLRTNLAPVLGFALDLKPDDELLPDDELPPVGAAAPSDELAPAGAALDAVGKRVMRNFGRNVVDTLLGPHLSAADLETMVSITGKEKVDTIIASGRGAVLVTVHLGSWELAGAALARMGYRITTVAGVQFTPALSPFIKAAKKELGITVVSVHGGTRTILQALGGGGLVALHIDGDQYVGGVEVTFFGRRVTLPRGPAALALRTGAGLMPAFAIRTSRQHLSIMMEDEIPTEGEDEITLTQKLAAVAESYVRQYPDQWCMFRNFWESERGRDLASDAPGDGELDR